MRLEAAVDAFGIDCPMWAASFVLNLSCLRILVLRS